MNRNINNILPCCLALKVTLLIFLICGASSPNLAVSASSQQPPTKNVEPDQVNPGDRITVHEKSGRVLELIVEEVNATDQIAFGLDITGTYISEDSGEVFTITQTGDEVSGTYGPSGKVWGTIRGSTIKLDYFRTGGWTGVGEWKVNSDGSKLRGSWTSSSRNHSGKWNLIRIDSVEATRHDDSPMIKGRLVSDQSAVEVLLVDIDKIEVQHVVSTSEVSDVSACRMSEATRDAIDRATDTAFSGNRADIEALDLIDEAEKAAGEPECDNVRAEILANKANELATVSATVKDDFDDSPGSMGLTSGSASASKSSKSSNSEFGQSYGKCVGGAALYGLIPITFGLTEPGLITTGAGIALCAPTVGIALSTEPSIEPSMKGSIDASSRRRHAAYRETEQQRFFALTKESLVRDMARGGGEYLAAMAYLEGCPVEVHGSFAKMTQRNFKQIIPQAEMDAEAMLHNLEAQIAKDPLLVASCDGVS